MARNLGRLTLDLVARTAEFNRNMQGASKTVSTETARIEDAATRASNAIKTLVATAGVGFSVSGIVAMADGYTGMVNKLKLVTNGQGELKKALDDTHKIAQATASDWDSVVTVYTKFQKISEHLGISQAEVARITETVTKAVGMSGASADESQRALNQFGQALNTGQLKGQDLNSVMSQTPGLIDAIAEGMGVATSKIKDMGAAGELTNEVIITSLQKVASSVDKKYAETATLIASSFDYIKNEAKKMIGEFDEAHQVSQKFVESMKSLSENLETVAVITGIGAAVYVGKYTPAVLASMKSLAIKTKAQIADIQATNIANEIAAHRTARILHLTEIELKNARATAARMSGMQRLAFFEKTLIPLEQRYTAAIAANTTAQNANNASKNLATKIGGGLLSLVGGWAGLAVTLGMVAGGYLLTRKNAEETTKILNEQGETLDSIILKFKEMSESAKNVQYRTEQEELKKLNKEFDDANSKLVAIALNFGRFDGSTSVATKKAAELAQQFKKGDIDAEKFATEIRNLVGISEKSKTKFDEQAKAVGVSSSAFTQQKGIVNTLASELKKAANQQDNLNKKMTAAEQAAKTAEEAYKKYAVSFSADKQAAVFENSMLNRFGDKYSQEQRKVMLEWAKTYNFDQLQMKSDVARNDLNARLEVLKLQQQSGKIQDAINDKEKQRLDLVKAQGNAMKVNSLVASNAEKYEFSKLEEQYNLLPGLLSAINMKESRGDTNAIGPMTKYGTAKGGFQLLDGTAKRFGLVGRDVFDTGKSAEAAAKYFQFLYKKFGDWNKAISAYHAGEGNVEKGTNIGPVNRQYVKDVGGYLAGAANMEFSIDFTNEDYIKVIEDAVKYSEELSNKQKEVRIQYASDIEKIEAKLADQIADIKAAQFDQDEEKVLIYKAQQLANTEIDEFKQAQEEKLSIYRNFVKTEEELLKDSFDAKQRALRRDFTLTLEGFTEASFLLDQQRNLEISKLRIARQDQIAEYKIALTEIRNDADDAILQRIDPRAYDRSLLNREFSSKDARIDLDYQKSTDLIMQEGDEENRNAQLLSAHKLYLEAKQALDEEYSEKERQLKYDDYSYTLDIYSQMTSAVASTMSQMMNVVSQVKDENSKTYKSMFALNQSVAMSQALINTEEGATKALAQGGIYGSTLAGIIRASGYASIAIMAAQTVKGFSDGGYTGHGGKYDAAGIVHKGEVVWSQDDIKRWGGVDKVEAMRRGIPGYSDGGIVGNLALPKSVGESTSLIHKQQNVQPIVNVNTLAGTTADVSTANDGSLLIEIRRIAQEEAERSWDGLSRPNSRQSKAFRQFTTARPSFK